MADFNKKYGKAISDQNYIERVISDMQKKINNQRDSEEGYSEDGLKDVILDKLDDMGIYPDDIDYVFSELVF